MRRTGADGYFLSHNHPSGNSEASSGDYNYTSSLSYRIPGFRGHIVTNGSEYTFIKGADSVGHIKWSDTTERRMIAWAVEHSDYGKYEKIFITNSANLRRESKKIKFKKESNEHLRESIEHPLIGTDITNPGRFIGIAKNIRSDENHVTILYASTDGVLRGIQEVPVKFFQTQRLWTKSP